MVSKRWLSYYFSVGVGKDSKIWISEIISSASNDVNQAIVKVKDEVKKRVDKRKKYENIPDKVRKEGER